MSKISKFKQAQRKQIDELIAEMFIEEDAETALSRKKESYKDMIYPVVILLSSDICRLRRSSQER